MILNIGDVVRERGPSPFASAWCVEGYLASGRHFRHYTVTNLMPDMDGQRAVLKVIKYDPRRIDDADYIQSLRARLRRECETLAHFSPRLPEPIDYFEIDNAQDQFEGFGAEQMRMREPILIQTLLHGSSLAQQMEDRGAPPAAADTLLLTLAKVCSFLDELHAGGRGWLFWALSPEHIMVDPQQEHEPSFVGCSNFRMLNHGVVVDDPSIPILHQPPEPGYAAPEALSRSRSDRRVDVYAMGCLLFHLFTGTDPRDLAEDILSRGAYGEHASRDEAFDRTDVHVPQTMTLSEAQTFCDELRSSMERFCRRNLKGLGISRARVRRMLLKAVEPEPDDRFQSPLELRDRLLATLSRSRPVAWPNPGPDR
ncbi:MAG: hypothetical protein AAFS10_20440 [Myxococcota bacterium]